jgi:hypothetical protein
MKRKLVISFFSLLLIMGVIAYLTMPELGHGGNNVIVSVAGVQKYLQTAITDGSLMSGLSVDAANPSTPTGHNGDQVMITIGGGDKTLQQAITDGDFISVSNSYSDSLSVYGLYDGDALKYAFTNARSATCAPGYYIESSSCVGVQEPGDPDWKATTIDCRKGFFTTDAGSNSVSCLYVTPQSGTGHNYGSCLLSFTCVKG